MASDGPSAMPPSTTLPFKSAYERYVDTVSEITSLNIQLAMLETCSHTKLGEFARPFSVRFGCKTTGGGSHPPVAHLTPRTVSIDHLYDDNGVNLYERFLRSHMRLVAVTKLAFGPTSVECIGAELALAESYMRAGLWKQCHDHARVAEAILNEDDGVLNSLSPGGSSPLKSPSSMVKWHASRTTDAQLHHARALFSKMGATAGLCSRHDIVAAFGGSDYFQLVQGTTFIGSMYDRYLHTQDASFQSYLRHLERTMQPEVLAALMTAFQSVQTSLDEINTTSHLVSSGSISDVLLTHNSADVQRIGHYVKSPPTAQGALQITWPELVEAASRATTNAARAGMQCKTLLLHGRYHMKRGQVDDAILWLRRAVAGQVVVVGRDNHDMVDYFVAMADALCLKHTQSLQMAKDAHDQSFDKWCLSEEGVAACRNEALHILEDVHQSSRAKSFMQKQKTIKLPSKKEVEALARQNLRDRHQHGGVGSNSHPATSITAFLDEATELYVHVWTLEEQHYGRQDANTAIAYAGLGNVYILRYEPNEAVGYYTKAIDTFEAACDGAVPASAFLRMHLAKVHMHLQRKVDAMTLLHEAATFFKSHASQFLDSETTRRDAAANAIDAWRGWLQLANGDAHVDTPSIYRNMVEAAEIGYGEFSVEAADAMVAEGHYLLNVGNTDKGEEALTAASYIMEIHYGIHDKRVRKLRQEVVSVGAKRKQGEPSS
ncbi:hypothetical protein DYB25_012916 [Aphanomyces astaci]|uniref:Uncharacterized protein n=1 Tax=Aphanomyces astaci TaxID=112090 RepID=A0A397ATQ5_APHAT|nr:hypothetical protein DYB25_012916 [Aphanomyces astaci]